MAIGFEQYLQERYLRVAEKFSSNTCPGCGLGILKGLILRVIDELKIDMDNLLMVSGIGCSASYVGSAFNVDTLHTTHGRAIAFATGAKMFNPQLKVIVASGDGDLGDIGGNHLIHAARRNIDLTVIMANNMLYGMTGGQAACTTPVGALTLTTQKGNPYRPFDFPKLVKAAGAAYVARYSVTQPLALMNSIKKALETQGFSFIEVLAPCPVQFGRRNKLDTPANMFKFLMDKCISAEGLEAEELRDKIITGELSDGG